MFEEIVGTSPTLRNVLSRISKVAPTDSTVLITGETGTGKELIARGIHRRSSRGARAFISVNCTAVPRELIPSELFGHEKGAFTGATQRRLGRFELAHEGTIFLDEVGDLAPDTQIALLRVLQEREFERVGGGQSIPIDVRVIAATNRDLKTAVATGTFRRDLFYRLNVFPIEVPPLRERREDILMLVEYFVQRFAAKAGRNITSIDQKALDVLQSYDWPGNIRELQNIIERSVILTFGEVFSVDELWLSRQTSRSNSMAELYRFLGYSRGYSHFQIDPMLYEDVKEFVLRRRPETKGLFRTWSNSKIRVLRMAARELEISEELLVFTGHQRAVFAAPLAENWRELLLGNDVHSARISYPASDIVDYWKRIWLDRRLKDGSVTKAVRAFLPQELRISRLLEENNE
jgi:transcriptional regulator with GAF, ATPase, and Fis domain